MTARMDAALWRGRFVDGSQSLDAFTRMIHFVNVVLQCGLKCSLIKLVLLHPIHVLLRPRLLHCLGRSDAMPQHKLAESMLARS